MLRRTLIVVALAVCGEALAITYNDASNGNWSSASTWNPSSGYPGAGDTAIIDSHEVTANVSINTNITLVNVVTNGKLTLLTAPPQTNNVRLSGGAMNGYTYDASATNNGTIEVTADSAFDMYYYGRLALFGPITSLSQGLTLSRTGGGAVELHGNSPGYSGKWNISQGTLYLYAPQALGTGVLVTVGTATPGNVADLYFSRWANPSSYDGVGPGAFLVTTNGTLEINGYDASCTVDYSNDPVLTLAGGTLKIWGNPPGWGSWNDPVNVASGCISTVEGSYDQGQINGPISGAGGLETVSYNLHFNGNNRDFTGTLWVNNRTADTGKMLELTSTNSVPSGPIVICNTNVTLSLNAAIDTDWPMSNAVSGIGTIRVETGDGSNKIILSGGSISPGSSNILATTNTTGILKIQGGLAFTNNASQYPLLNIDIAGSNNVAGIDYDRLAVSNAVTGVNCVDLNVNIGTNVTPEMVSGQQFTILTCTNSLAGQVFRSVSWPIPGTQRGRWRGEVECGYDTTNGFARISNLRVIASGTLIVLQ